MEKQDESLRIIEQHSIAPQNESVEIAILPNNLTSASIDKLKSVERTRNKSFELMESRISHQNEYEEDAEVKVEVVEVAEFTADKAAADVAQEEAGEVAEKAALADEVNVDTTTIRIEEKKEHS